MQLRCSGRNLGCSIDDANGKIGCRRLLVFAEHIYTYLGQLSTTEYSLELEGRVKFSLNDGSIAFQGLYNPPGLLTLGVHVGAGLSPYRS